MPQTKSAAKAMRGSQRKHTFNLRTKRKYKNAIKIVRDAVKGNDPKTAQESLSNAYRQLDWAAKKRVIHPNKAARLKSRLALAVGRLSSSAG